MFQSFRLLLEEKFGIDPIYAGPILSISVIVVMLVIYWIVTHFVKRYVREKAQKPENAQNFLLLWRYGWMGVIFVFALISFSGSLAAVGLSAAFVGMILGWSLQAPVTGIAAWLMIILKRPFRIGDRVIISGIIGDVTDINLTHVVLNQVGGTISGEEKSGRGVLIPNATLFSQVIYNYTLETDYILDEVPVMITYTSSRQEAERILLEAAREVTADIMEATNTDPFTRCEFTDWGMRIRLRYQTMATDRQRISTQIVNRIFDAFSGNELVEFCYPHSEVIYREKEKPPALLGH